MCIVEAGKWGAGGTLSNVDMVISMCIRSRTLVCFPACIRGMKGTGETDVVLLARRPFCSSRAEKESLIDAEGKRGRHNTVAYKEIWLNTIFWPV